MADKETIKFPDLVIYSNKITEPVQAIKRDAVVPN